MPAPARTILILGGTREAAALAGRLAARAATRVISSLAGRTREPAPLAGETRIGGFGGAAGLAKFIGGNGVDTLIDATHPFAAQISDNAADAAAMAGVPLLRLARPAWQREPGDDWVGVATLDEAANRIPARATAFLALGSQHLAAFARRDDVAFVVRMVDPPEAPPPFAQSTLVLGRPSTDAGEEAAMLSAHGVTVIVCRNSGGRGAFAKLLAARKLKLPVIMIERPPAPAGGRTFQTVEALLAAL